MTPADTTPRLDVPDTVAEVVAWSVGEHPGSGLVDALPDSAVSEVEERVGVAGDDGGEDRTAPAQADDGAGIVPPFGRSQRRRPWPSRVRLAVGSMVSVAVLALAGITTYSLMSGSWTLTPVLSGSMAPGLPVGGVAVAQRTSVHNLAVRDVVIFQNPTRPTVQVVHRIIKLTYDGKGRAVIKTQGDANRDPDPWTATIFGSSAYVVRSSLPLLGYLAIRTNHGLDMMIGGVIVLAVAASVLLSLRARRPRRAED